MNGADKTEGSRYGLAVAAVVGIAACFVMMRPVPAHDLWWQLASARAFFSGGFGTEEFSHTMPGITVVEFEWLFGAVAYVAQRLGGSSGLVILLGLLVLAALLAMEKALPRDALPSLKIACLWLAAQSLIVRTELRPELANYALFMVFYGRIARLAHPDAGAVLWRRTAVLLALLSALWSNFHGGYVLGLFLIGAYAAGAVYRDRSLRAAAPYVGLFLLCAFATLCNPFGWRIWGVFWHHLTVVQHTANIVEWLPTSIEWGTYTYWIILLVSLVLLPRRWLAASGSFRLEEVIIFVVFGLLSLTSVRNVTLFSWAIIPVLARSLQGFWPRIKPVIRIAIVVLPGLVYLMLVVQPSGYERFSGVVRPQHPETALRFLDKAQIEGTMYNEYGAGGFISWRTEGRRKIFFDGRYIFNDLLNEATAARKGPGSWKSFLEKYGVDYAVVAYPNAHFTLTLPGDRKVPASIYRYMYFQPDTWALVWWDDAALVYLRRTGRYQAVIDEYEYLWLDPTNTDELQYAVASGMCDEVRLESEFKRHHRTAGKSARRAIIQELLERRSPEVF